MLKKLLLLHILLFFVNIQVSYAYFDAGNLGTLFLDVEQRKEIDAMRSGVAKEKPAIKTRKTEKITVRGFIKRSDGENVVWVNQGNTLQGNTVSDVTVNAEAIGQSNEVSLVVDGKQLKLKPGESWLDVHNK